MKPRIGQDLVSQDQSREGVCMDLGGQLGLEDRQGQQKQRKQEERRDEAREEAARAPFQRRRKTLQCLCGAELIYIPHQG